MADKRKSNYSKSVYAPGPQAGEVETHILSILVDNQPGVLARVIGLFSGRGYNIDSLTVAETDHDRNLSRITIVTSGTEMVIDQIAAQLESIIPVRSVRDLTTFGEHVDRELALVKIIGNEIKDSGAHRIATEFNAEIVDETKNSVIFQVTGTSKTIDEFIDLMRPLGLRDVSRSGVAALSRGTKAIGET